MSIGGVNENNNINNNSSINYSSVNKSNNEENSVFSGENREVINTYVEDGHLVREYSDGTSEVDTSGTIEGVENAGRPIREVQLDDMISVGYSIDQMLDAGYSLDELQNAGCDIDGYLNDKNAGEQKDNNPGFFGSIVNFFKGIFGLE